MPEIGEIKNFKKTVTQKFIWLACKSCGKERWVRFCPSRPPNLCRGCYDRDRKNLAHRGEDSHAWKGGRRTVKGGYITINVSPDDPFFPMADRNHYIPEHRLVMAKHLGRCLDKSEHVHHKNGVREDNRIENLEIQTPSEHTPQAHYKKRIKELEKEVASLKGAGYVP